MTKPVTQALKDDLVEWISSGETLRDWCRNNDFSASTVYGWINADQVLFAHIARAREAGEEIIAQECMEIADNATNDWMEQNSDGEAVGWKLNGDHVQRSKLRIETRLKLLAKWNPRKWGERQQVEHSGKIGLEQMISSAGEE